MSDDWDTYLQSATRQAEQAANAVNDPELRSIAYDRVLEHILGQFLGPDVPGLPASSGGRYWDRTSDPYDVNVEPASETRTNPRKAD